MGNTVSKSTWENVSGPQSFELVRMCGFRLRNESRSGNSRLHFDTLGTTDTCRMHGDRNEFGSPLLPRRRRNRFARARGVRRRADRAPDERRDEGTDQCATGPGSITMAAWCRVVPRQNRRSPPHVSWHTEPSRAASLHCTLPLSLSLSLSPYKYVYIYIYIYICIIYIYMCVYP